MSIDVRSQLAALLGHLNTHTNLAETVMTAQASDHSGIRVHASPRDAASHAALTILADWTRTLLDVSPVTVAAIADEPDYTHLHVVGHLAGGIAVRVVVILLRDEADLLAANTPVEVGATFPVSLLLQLTSAANAERLEQAVNDQFAADLDSAMRGQVAR
jgi:hypothetical protein